MSSPVGEFQFPCGVSSSSLLGFVSGSELFQLSCNSSHWFSRKITVKESSPHIVSCLFAGVLDRHFAVWLATLECICKADHLVIYISFNFLCKAAKLPAQRYSGRGYHLHCGHPMHCFASRPPKLHHQIHQYITHKWDVSHYTNCLDAFNGEQKICLLWFTLCFTCVCFC